MGKKNNIRKGGAKVKPELSVPAQFVIMLKAPAHGVQIYTCKGSGTQLAWSPATPDAVAATVAEIVKRLECEGPVGCTLPAVVSGGTVRTAAQGGGGITPRSTVTALKTYPF